MSQLKILVENGKRNKRYDQTHIFTILSTIVGINKDLTIYRDIIFKKLREL